MFVKYLDNWCLLCLLLYETYAYNKVICYITVVPLCVYDLVQSKLLLLRSMSHHYHISCPLKGQQIHEILLTKGHFSGWISIAFLFFPLWPYNKSSQIFAVTWAITFMLHIFTQVAICTFIYIVCMLHGSNPWLRSALL